MNSSDVDLMKKATLSMFKKNLIGLKQGSISAKKNNDTFLITRQQTIFDEITSDDFTHVSISKKAMWTMASKDAPVHAAIYAEIPSAKYIACLAPPKTMAHIITNNYVIPQDYFGFNTFSMLEVYNPKDITDWSNRAPTEVIRHMIQQKKHVVAIRGIGLIIYAKNLNELLETASAVEQSCEILILQKLLSLN